MIGFHFRDPVNDWPAAVAKLPAGTPVKFFWTEGAREAKAANPRIRTVRRHHIDHQDPYLFAADKDQAARNFFDTFIDGTFMQYAASWDYVEELNEYASHTNPAEELVQKIEWAVTCARVWKTEYRTRPELAHIRLIVGNLPIGNDWGPNGWKVARACVEYDAVMGYHPYIPTKAGIPHPDEWPNYSGRWEAMDTGWRGMGYRVDWVFTEGGPIGYDARQGNGIGALHAEDGWLHSDVCGGDLNAVKAIMGDWRDRAAGTTAYAEGRVLGLTLFDSAFNGWKWFQYKDQNLQDMAAWSGAYAPPPPPPADNRARGIDVSHHQGAFPWEAVKAQNPQGLDFAFIRASQGMLVDTQWGRNVAECHAHGIPFGAYHFLRSDASPAAQASLFASLLQETGISLPAVVDVEKNLDDTYPSDAQVRAFCDAFRAECDHPLYIYTSYSAWLAATGGAIWPASSVGLWVAHYTTAEKPLLPAGWDEWHFWQYTSKGKLNGYAGVLDFNRFFGDMATLQQYIMQWGGEQPPSGPPEMPALLDGTIVLNFEGGQTLTVSVAGGVWS